MGHTENDPRHTNSGKGRKRSPTLLSPSRSRCLLFAALEGRMYLLVYVCLCLLYVRYVSVPAIQAQALVFASTLRRRSRVPAGGPSLVGKYRTVSHRR